MKIIVILTVAILFITCEGIPNYIGTELQRCLNCVCHTTTGCFNRITCANYSINFDYWKKAKSPVIDVNDEPNSEESFKKCMKNENCILVTLVQYAEAIGHIDCNCDGQFDCKDRFAIHLNGKECINPEFPSIYVERFNQCSKDLGVSKMMPKEGFEGCVPEVF